MAFTNLQPTPTSVLKALESIVQTARPVRVLAFGSRARGQGQPHSDLDLLVILAGGAELAGVAGNIYEAVGATGFAKDIVVTEETSFEQMRFSLNSLQAEVARDGVILYEHGCTNRNAIEKVCQ